MLRAATQKVVSIALLAMLVAPVKAQDNIGQYESKYRRIDETELQRATAEDNAQEKPQKLQPADPGSAEAAAQLKQFADDPYAQSLLLNQFGQQSIRDGNYEQALGYLEKLLKLKALDAEVLDPVRAQLPALYAATKQYTKLIRALEKKAQQPDGLQAVEWLQLADAYLQSERYKSALRPLDQAIALSSKKNGAAPQAWYRTKLALLQKLKRKQAQRETLQTLLRLFPSEAEYWLQLAQLQASAKRWRSAVSTLDLAYRQSLITEADQLLLYARLTNRAGWPHRAGALMQTWVEQELLANSAAHHREIASYWLAAHEHGRAIDALELAVKKTTQEGGSGVQIATLNLQLGQLNIDVARWAEAIEALDAALATDKVKASLGRAHLLRGTAFYQTGHYEKALAAFTAAREQNDVSQAADQWLNFIGQLATNDIAPASLSSALRSAAERGELTWANAELNQRLARPAARVDVSAGTLPGTLQPTAIAAAPAVNNNATTSNLGTLLTPVGATQPGTPDGLVPAWNGGITLQNAPAGYVAGQRPLHPFADEQPLYTVTADNMVDHQDYLSAGHQALLEKYSAYQLPVYPSHRTAAYPEAVYAATLDNAEVAELEGTESIQNATLGFPFPKPDVGAEVIWNHKMRYRGTTRVSVNTSAAVINGKIEQRTGKQKVYFAYGNLTKPVSTDESNRLVYGLFQRGTGKRSDGVALIHEPADHERQQRKIWVGGDGSRGRLITVPFVGYDFPIQNGNIFIDQLDMYNGAFDYYAWKLVGKRTMLVPYNAYPSIDPAVMHDKMLSTAHLNPSITRYEMHRVWLVDAQLRVGENHKLPRRRFYVDEDSWTILMVDNYNAEGNLHKFQEAHPFAVYDQPFVEFAVMAVYDLLNDNYSVLGMNNEHPFWQIDDGSVRPGDFTPNAAKRLLR